MIDGMFECIIENHRSFSRPHITIIWNNLKQRGPKRGNHAVWEKRIPFTAMKNIACQNHYFRAHIRTKTFIVFPTILSMLEHYEDNQIELSKQFDNQMELTRPQR